MKKTILVTDSGLGGLSVFAEIAAGLEKRSAWPNVSLVYFNAWPEQYRGYNHLPHTRAKAWVFNNAMVRMAQFEPDQILIACNTLSVIYPETDFSRTTAIPVTGIVDHGVDMIEAGLRQEPDSCVIIFSTPTTAQAGSHETALLERGIPRSRIITQGCVDLAGKIERNPFGHEVDQMIRENTAQASILCPKKVKKVFAALCCTHFGYRRELFESHVRSQICDRVEILNPNERMAQQVVDSAFQKERTPGADIDMTIVSRVEWDPGRIGAYEKLLSGYPGVVRALKAYELDPDLFDVAGFDPGKDA